MPQALQNIPNTQSVFTIPSKDEIERVFLNKQHEISVLSRDWDDDVLSFAQYYSPTSD